MFHKNVALKIFRCIHRKKSVLEYHFNKVVTMLILTQVFSCKYFEIFQSTYFEEQRTAAIVIFQNYFPEHLK